MSTGLPSSPAEMRAYIVERLVGETGEPDRVTGAARALVEKAVPKIREAFKQNLALDVSLEVGEVALARVADAKPDAQGHAMAVVAAEGSPETVIVLFDADAIALIVSILFGGDPGARVAPIRRDLSPTEIVVASQAVREIAAALAEAGEGTLNLVLPPPPAASGEDLRKVALRDGPGARVVLAVSTPSGGGQMTLVIPQRLLLKGSPAAGSQHAAPTAQWRQRFGEEVMRSGVELQATMPVARMTLGQITRLEPGQVIEFEPEAQSHARLSTRQKTLFVCEFGKLGQNYTVRIRHPFETGQDVTEGLVATR